MQTSKIVSFVVTSLAFALTTFPCVASELDEKRPPIVLKIGEELPVDLKGVSEAVDVLESVEKSEFLRDVLMTTAFSSFSSTQECRHDFLAMFGALRRPHLDPLSPGEVGRGRFAALSKETGLLLLPFDATGKSFDLTVAYRILDKQLCQAGRLPDVVHVVTYRLETSGKDAAKASLTHLQSIQTENFYTNDEHGYSEKAITETADLEKFLEHVDDLLTIRVKSGKDATLIVSGRKYPEGTYKATVRDRVTLDDLKVLWAAFHDASADEEKLATKIKLIDKQALKLELKQTFEKTLKGRDLAEAKQELELLFKDENSVKFESFVRDMLKEQLALVGEKGSELGFSLDPWIDLEKLQQLLSELLQDEDELRTRITAAHFDSLEECKKRLDAILKNHIEGPDNDKQAPVMEIPSSKEYDRTGLFVFKDDVNRELQKSPDDTKLKLLATLLEEITQESQFIRARYEGVQAGTSVAMTMYYCDLIAKAYAFGQVAVEEYDLETMGEAVSPKALEPFSGELPPLLKEKLQRCSKQIRELLDDGEDTLSLATDETGLAGLLDDFDAELSKPGVAESVKSLGDYLRDTLQDAAVGYTARQILNLPRIDGFKSWPRIRLGGQYWDEIRKAKNLRLWWSADTNGFRWDENRDETRIAFCPQAVRISFRNKVGEIAEEEEPDPLRAAFRDSWNQYYLDIADLDCVFHHFNQIYKWAIAIKSLKEFEQADCLKLLAGKLEQTDLRFDKWYQDAVRQEKVGFQVKFDFSKRYKGITEETMGFVHSGEYEEAGRSAGWTGGGDLGPTKEDVKSAKRSFAPDRMTGAEILLPSGRKIIVPGEGQERVAVVPANSAKLDSPSVRLLLPRGRLESELVVGPQISTLRNWVNDGSGAIDSSRLTTKMVDGRVVVEWADGAYDRAFRITRSIGAGEELDANQVAEIRYSETGDRILLRLAGDENSEPAWLEVLPGGSGGGKMPPTNAIAIGSPGEPNWFYAMVRTEVKDDELARYQSSNGKGFIRVELTGRAFSPYQLDTEWFPKPPEPLNLASLVGQLNPVSLFGKGVTAEEVKGSLLNASAGENRCISLLFGTIADPAKSKRLAEVARLGLQRDAQDEAFNLFARTIGRGATPVEILIGSGKDRLMVTRQGDIYVVSREAETGNLLPAESPFRYVVTEPETPTLQGVRVVEQTVILPESPTDTHRKTAGEVVEFLTKNPDLIPIASNVSDLNTEALTKLKAGYESLGKSAMLEWDGKTYSINGGNVKFTRGQLIRWSTQAPENRAAGEGLPEGVLDALKRQPLVFNELQTEDFATKDSFGQALRELQAHGVQVTLKLSDTPANAMPSRLKELMAWNQLDFEAESIALDQLTNTPVKRFAIDYLGIKTLSSRLGWEGDGLQLVRVIVDHAKDKLTIQELISRAKRDEYRGRHVVLGVCNESAADIVAFCKAAYAHGCRGVVIPSAQVSIPIVLLTAESLNGNPLFRSGSIPQAAWTKAEQSVLEKLDTVKAEAKEDDATVLRLIDQAFPVQLGAKKMSDMFRDEDGSPKGAIIRIDQFMKDAKRNTWNQTTSRPLRVSDILFAAA